jgi:cytochrome c
MPKPLPRPIAIKPKEHSMKKITVSLLVSLASIGAAHSARAQDAAAGENSFKKCLACHSIGEGAKNKVGPELNGIDGRKSGTAPDYSYSDANKNSGITWSKDQFLEYITDPKAKIPGTKMIFPGIKNEKERNDVWAYISQFDKDGKKK